MGQYFSQALEAPPTVETFDDFITRFRTLIRGLYFNRRDQQWLLNISAEFNPTPSAAGEWDESSLSRFLRTLVPEPLWPDLENSIPLLHRSLARLGSFPYHNAPPRPLTVDTALVAIAVMSFECNRKWLRFDQCAASEAAEEQQTQRWAHRVLFQSMSVAKVAAAGPAESRTDADDEDLLRAYQLVQEANQTRDWERNPTVVRHGDPIIPVQHLPSSQSRNMSGIIPRSEFKSLLKLLLHFQLYLAGEPVADQSLDVAVDSVLGAFLPADADESSDIEWDAFEAATNAIGPNLFLNIGYLGSPIEEPNDLKPTNPFNVKDMALWVEQTFLPPKHTGLPTGAILNSASLSQLLAILPRSFVFTPTTSVSSFQNGEFNIGVLHQHLTSGQRPIILLISSAGSSVLAGAVFPAEESENHEGLVWQLVPTLKVARSQGDAIQTTLDRSASQLTVSIGASRICLWEDGRAEICGFGGLTLQFLIEAMEVIFV
ncbi:hypothetical protein MCOR27_009372 [Pyricularia oryzae]|nr:hypothetical protein MCOR01_006709 [Pyricularia oryzae]KAI6270254.1 hypothetical protein MCOR27_009372 [Pyricularia oryzae]KAI6287408.1 hypothetical protein MCOR26_000660 [Pyricularia oryzae]KAI6307612.1 hypothetical protein MCOR34_007501 [Pyricularia oryzae]KAI6310119.1 hypothetical protein MCOR29_008721 [Pyricularia oryzae]